MRRATQEAKDALIRAAARLTGERVDQASLAEAFTELAGSVAWLTRIPGAHAIVYDFGRMIAEKLNAVRVEHRAEAAEPLDEVRQSLDLERDVKKCPHCGMYL